MEILNIPILLASQSPRRRDLLTMSGFQFRIHPADIDESFPDDMPVEEVAEFLAREKATAVKSEIREGEVALAADSTVILHGDIYNKPIDRADALRMLRALSGEKHRVVTGVALATTDKMVSFSGISDVLFSELSDEEIAFYVDTYEPFDKAGSYGIQEWLGLCKIERIEGTYPNIMGLPVELVYQHLQQFL